MLRTQLYPIWGAGIVHMFTRLYTWGKILKSEFVFYKKTQSHFSGKIGVISMTKTRENLIYRRFTYIYVVNKNAVWVGYWQTLSSSLCPGTFIKV